MAIIVSGSDGVDFPTLTDALKRRHLNDLGVPGKNYVTNGRFDVDQRNAGSKATADTVYGPDRWKYLGENTSTVGGRNTSMALGYNNGYITFTSANGKGGFWQTFKSEECKELRGKIVTLSFKILVSNARIGNIKAGIVEWASTADSPTADPISSWGADGTTPTLAANFSFVNTPANLNVTTSSAEYSITTSALSSSFNNLAVFIWNDDKVYNANDEFFLTDVKLEEGGYVTPFVGEPFIAQLRRCQEFFYKTFPQGTAPAQNAGTAGCIIAPIVQYAAATINISAHVRYPVPMRTTPTVTTYNPSNTNNQFRDLAGGSGDWGITQEYSAADCIHLLGSGGVGTAERRYGIHLAADAEIS